MNTALLELVSESVAQTESLAERLGAACRGGELLVLSGELGAGKTAFVRGLARGLGIEARRIRSPSYTLHHRHAGRRTLNHFDVYFTDTAEDLERSDLRALLEAGEVVAMEWGERFEHDLPPGAIQVEILHTGPETRALRFRAADPRGQALLDGLQDCR